MQSVFTRGAYLSILGAAFLAGCGGGGSDTTNNSSVAAAVSFPLQSAYKARVASGSSANFSVSGTCSGTATMSVSAPSASTFEGAATLAATSTITTNFTNCTPSSNAVTGTNYYDSNYTPLGSSIPSTEYGKFLVAPSSLPTSVKVGDTAVYGTETLYTDSTKATVKGKRELSYAIEPDTASTAIANFIIRTYNSSSQLLSTQQSRYRIDTSGTLRMVSLDVQNSTTSTTHLIYTPR